MVTGGYVYYKGSHAAGNPWVSSLEYLGCPSYYGFPATIPAATNNIHCVKVAQYVLQKYAGDNVQLTGAYDPATKAAVISWQRFFGQTANGVISSQTWLSMANVVNNVSSIHKVGDLNGDGTINVLDLAILETNFSKTGVSYIKGDLNGDGTVNIYDEAIMRNNWTDKTNPAPVVGDINGDGIVNISDLSILDSHLGKTGTKAQGDLNGDGVINIVDKAILQAHLPQSSPSPLIGDINGDGVVNILDEAILMSHYGKSGMTKAQGDLNGDGVVNVFDLSILLNNMPQ